MTGTVRRLRCRYWPAMPPEHRHLDRADAYGTRAMTCFAISVGAMIVAVILAVLALVLH